jgi:putative spermidine/putrescine transport system substrate-binding protein
VFSPDHKVVAGAALALFILAASTAAGYAQSTLSIATWGGAYGQAQEIALFEPFVRKTGTAVATEIYNGDLGKLKTMIDSDRAPVDVVDVSASVLDSLCKDGALETLNAASFSAVGDFLDGAISDCGVASVAWSTVIAFDRKAFHNGAPDKISALLDTARFPGKRALPKNARYTLELALLADGVPPESVYQELATPEGSDRAFAALGKITNDVLLWEDPSQPITWLLEDKVSMAAGYTGRVFRAAVGDMDVGIIWDGQIYDVDAWAIPKTAENKDPLYPVRHGTGPACRASADDGVRPHAEVSHRPRGHPSRNRRRDADISADLARKFPECPAIRRDVVAAEWLGTEAAVCRVAGKSRRGREGPRGGAQGQGRGREGDDAQGRTLAIHSSATRCCKSRCG